MQLANEDCITIELISQYLTVARMFGCEGRLANHQRLAKLKPSKLIVTINNFLANLFIRQDLYPSTFAKHYRHQTFLHARYRIGYIRMLTMMMASM